jgi:hypothetical protein
MTCTASRQKSTGNIIWSQYLIELLLNPNIEYRNPKQILMFKIQNPKRLNWASERMSQVLNIWALEFWTLGFRASDLGFFY